MKRIITIFIIIIIKVSLFSGIIYNPPIFLFEEKTENFTFIFEEDLYFVYEELRDFSEYHYNIFKEIYETEPKNIKVFIIDDVDFVNGFAIPFLNTIRIYLNKPSIEQSLMYNPKEWFKLVFLHELNHIFYGNMIKSENLNKIPFDLLKSILNHSYQPLYIHEGLCILHESLFFEGTRFDNDYFEMLLREEILRDDFPRYHYGGGAPINIWTPAGFSYMYGVLLTREIIEFYSYEILLDIVKHLNSSFFSSISKSFEEITNDNWEEFIQKIKNNYVLQKEKQINNFTFEINNIDKSFRNTSNLKTDGKFLYSYKETYDKIYGVYKDDELIIRNAKKFDVSSNGNVAYITSTTNFSGQTNDLYIHCKNCPSTDIYIDSRVSNVAFINDNLIAYVKLDKGMQALYTYQIDRYIYRKVVDFGFNNFDSLTGRDNQLFFASNKQNENNIFKYDIEKREITQITFDSNIQRDLFVKDNYLFFSANYENNRYNIFRLDLENNEINQITNYYSGSFNPTVINNNIYYTVYSSEGFHISKSELMIKENFESYKVNYPENITFESIDIESSLELNLKRYRKDFPILLPFPSYNFDHELFGIDLFVIDRDLNYNGVFGIYSNFKDSIGLSGYFNFDLFFNNTIYFDLFIDYLYSLKISRNIEFWTKNKNSLYISGELGFFNLDLDFYTIEARYRSSLYRKNNFLLYNYGIDFFRKIILWDYYEEDEKEKDQHILVLRKPFILFNSRFEAFTIASLLGEDDFDIKIGLDFKNYIWNPFFTLSDGKYRFDSLMLELKPVYSLLNNDFEITFTIGFDFSLFYWISLKPRIPIKF